MSRNPQSTFPRSVVCGYIQRKRELTLVFKYATPETMFSKFPELSPTGRELDAAFLEATAAFPGIDKTPDRWSGLNTPSMIEAIVDEGIKCEIMSAYDLAYRSLSAHVHPCVQAVRVAAPGADRGTELLSFGVPIVAVEAAIAATRCLCAASGIEPPDTDTVLRRCLAGARE